MIWIKKLTDNGKEYQQDTVGNITFQDGSIKPIKCQKCKKQFDTKPTITERKQKIPLYRCKDCEFENHSGDSALDHKITTDHKIDKTVRERIVGYQSKLLGRVPYIAKLENDISILCGDCNDN